MSVLGGLVWVGLLIVHCSSTKHLRVTSALKVSLNYNYEITIDTITTNFIIVGETANRFTRLQNVFSAPITELYLLFYQSALQVFLHFNMFLQREDPLIPIIHKQIISFLTKLATKFLLVSTIKAAKGDFSSMPYKDSTKQLSGDSHNNVSIAS